MFGAVSRSQVAKASRTGVKGRFQAATSMKQGAMRIKLIVAVGAAIGVTACGGQSPTVPLASTTMTSSSPFSPAAPRLTGIVQDDRGAPIAAATVYAYLGSTVQTDSQGLFYMPINAPGGASFGLVVSKEGYEPQPHLWVSGPTEIITLHDVIRLPVGESIRLTVGPKESADPDLEYHYRAIRVVSSSPVQLELRVVAADGAPPDWWVHEGPCCPTPSTLVKSMGTELPVGFKSPFGASRTYTLTTTKLEP
jgi:hypothetical protein